ncbi:MAG TPA: hypothetical protein VK973_03050, partial [Arenicellales bacterium]|nr:hypothetical protein [Arenicellales bacterium]
RACIHAGSCTATANRKLRDRLKREERSGMQKPITGDPSGRIDTMWDTIADAPGTLATSALGGWYREPDQRSPIKVRIGRLIERNPRLSRR